MSSTDIPLTHESPHLGLNRWLHTFDPVEKCTFVASCGTCGSQARIWFYGHPQSVLARQCPDLQTFEKYYHPQWHKCLRRQCHFCGNQHCRRACDRCGSQASTRAHLVWPETPATTGMGPRHHHDRVCEAWNVFPATTAPMGSSILCPKHGVLSSTGAFFHACISWSADVVVVASPWPQWDPANWAPHLQAPQQVGLLLNPLPEMAVNQDPA